MKHCVHSLPVWADMGPSPGWEGVTVGVGLKGWDFLVTLLPTFQTTPGSPGHLHPSMGFNSNKGLVATGASLSRQIMLSVSALLLGSSGSPLNRKRTSPSGNVFGVSQIKVDLNLRAHSFPHEYLN